jgi:hypothetical protein
MSEVNDKILSLVMGSLDEKKMDAVGQEDGDVDNDGDEDESDAYILKRRKAIKKAMTKEEAELEESDSYYAMMKAKEHAERDGKNYDGDVSVQHKYDAYHMKKRGYTHFTSGRFGNRTYHKGPAAGATKIDSSHHSGVHESVDEGFLDEDLTRQEIIELTAEIMIEENIDYDSLSEEEINELLGAVARGIGKVAGAAGRGIASRVTMAGRADRMAKKADKIAAKADNQDKLRAARQKIVAAKKRMAATKAAMRQDRQPNAMSRA